jgi:hypothetical protein
MHGMSQTVLLLQSSFNRLDQSDYDENSHELKYLEAPFSILPALPYTLG